VPNFLLKSFNRPPSKGGILIHDQSAATKVKRKNIYLCFINIKMTSTRVKLR
jgi:hypothetical protein